MATTTLCQLDLEGGGHYHGNYHTMSVGPGGRWSLPWQLPHYVSWTWRAVVITMATTTISIVPCHILVLGTIGLLLPQLVSFPDVQRGRGVRIRLCFNVVICIVRVCTYSLGALSAQRNWPTALLVGRVRMKFGPPRESMFSQARDERCMWDRYMYMTGTI